MAKTNDDSSRRTSWRSRTMGTLRVVGLSILAVLSTCVYFRLEMGGGMPILLFVVSLAIAGHGNRWLWSLIFPVLMGATGAVIWGVSQLMPKEAEFAMTLLGFVLVSVVPGAVLWLAATLKRARHSRAQ